MKLTVYCAHCDGEAEYDLDTKKVWAETTLGDILRDRNWIWQQNGDNFDIYCCVECAA